MSFYDKYIDLCMKAGEYPSVAAEKMGFHKSTVSSWKRRKTAPADITLHTVAKFFNVPVSYFQEDEPKKVSALENTFENATADERLDMAARLIESLSEEQQAALIQRIMFKK